MQALVEAAPKLMDFLGEASLAHFDRVRAVLDADGQPYRINPRLVRGMDYYNLTVFEWVTTSSAHRARSAAGVATTSWSSMIGGKPAPAVGWGLGIERVLDLLKRAGHRPPARTLDAYAVVPKPQRCRWP